MVFLKKIDLATPPVVDMAGLIYPSLVDYDLVFGENPFSQLQQTRFEFEIEGTSTEHWSYYTIAVYQHNWGLTDIRKSEYQIRVEVETRDCSGGQCINVQSSRGEVQEFIQ